MQAEPGSSQRGARLIPPRSPLPIPLQGSQLPAGKWGFRGVLRTYRLASGSFLAACVPQVVLHRWQRYPHGSLWPMSAALPAAAGRSEGSSALARSGRAITPVLPSQGTGTDVPSQFNTPAGPALAQVVPNPSAGGWHVVRHRTQDGSRDPSPPHCPGEAPSVGCVGAGGRSSRSAEADRSVGEERGRGCPAGAGRVKVGTDFGAKYEPCTGPGSGGGRVGPSLTAAPVEGDAGAQ